LDQEKVEIVKRAMVNKLTPFEMRILIAFYYEGLSVASIASDEGRSPKNIYTRLAQAYAKLKEELDGDR
jgi:RNA polymerase sigma factor (sigma-70 family)